MIATTRSVMNAIAPFAVFELSGPKRPSARMIMRRDEDMRRVGMGGMAIEL
jgi:hypothetical protein